MKGCLNFSCLECHSFIEWRKVPISRPDGWFDWRLDVSCGCGEVTDESVLAIARADYDEALGAELENQHRNYLNSMLGRSGNLYFETLVNALPFP